jgi:hypothetical protein
MSDWDPTLYGSDEAHDARGELLAEIPLPREPRLFAACIGLLALLDPTSDQFGQVQTHAALNELPPGLREASLVAATIGASGPSLPYSERTRVIIGIAGSYGRVIDPLLELRESVIFARAIRDRCIRAVDDGYTYGETAIGGVVGLLLELRELGVATNPDLVDGWTYTFDRLCEGEGEADDFMRAWSHSFRDGLTLLATEPERKLLGSDPTSEPRRSKPQV